MAITNSFKDDVSNGDVRGIRIMMKDSLLVDPTFSEFGEMENTARNIPGLYDAHDGQEFIHDKVVWNDDYMNKLMVEVVYNFSVERIRHLKDVVRYLRPVAACPQIRPQTTTSSGSYSENKQKPASGQTRQHHNHNDNSNRGVKITTGVLFGATAGGAIAAVTGLTVVGGVVIGAVVGGVVVTALTNEEI